MAAFLDDDMFKRMVLINQYTILSKIDPGNAAYWERSAAKVREHWPTDELPDYDELNSYARYPFTADDRAELLDTIEVHDLLQQAEDAGLSMGEDGMGYTAFPGYDGNNESTFLNYYRNLVDEGHKWPNLRRMNEHDLNSHGPFRDSYIRMVRAWRDIGSPRPLRQEHVTAIINARTHPENR